jgi:hypothetical protein
MRNKIFGGPQTILISLPMQLCLLFVPILVFGVFSAPPAIAHMKGMYETKAEAEKRAAQLKCKGAFQMGDKWMPCATERVLHDALQRQ